MLIFLRAAEAPLSLGGAGTIPVTLTLMKEVTHNIEGVLSAVSKLLGIKEPINFEKINESGVKERGGKWAQSPTPAPGEDLPLPLPLSLLLKLTFF